MLVFDESLTSQFHECLTSKSTLSPTLVTSPVPQPACPVKHQATSTPRTSHPSTPFPLYPPPSPPSLPPPQLQAQSRSLPALSSTSGNLHSTKLSHSLRLTHSLRLSGRLSHALSNANTGPLALSAGEGPLEGGEASGSGSGEGEGEGQGGMSKDDMRSPSGQLSFVGSHRMNTEAMLQVGVGTMVCYIWPDGLLYI